MCVKQLRATENVELDRVLDVLDLVCTNNFVFLKLY